MRPMLRAVRVLICVLLLMSGLYSRQAVAGEHLSILVPSPKNLQHMSFWVAKAGGYFAREGLDVELIVAPAPQQTEVMFDSGQGEAAVLAPPMYLRFMAAKMPLVLVANLLRHDPINLIVRRDVLEQRHLSSAMPMKARLEGLHGLRLGIAPHPPARLRALFTSQGLDIDKEVELVILHGREQNEAFAAKRVDALYAHTPWLEKAIVQDDAVVLVDQNGGEVKEVLERQIHCLAFRRSVSAARPAVVLAAVRAIAAAEKSIHASQSETVAVLAREFPTRDRRELETIVRLYEPAIPELPDVRVDDLKTALALFPEGLPKPDLSGIDLATYVAADVAPKARAEPPLEDGVRRRQWMVFAAGIACLVAVALGILTAPRRPKT